MNTEVRDILLKAAEDVQQGMWCKGVWFQGLDEDLDWDESDDAAARSLLDGTISLEKAMSVPRCAEGSIAVATALAGGTLVAFRDGISAVSKALGDCPKCSGIAASNRVFIHNDTCLPNNPFEAGQSLSELFRFTAENL